LACEFKQTNHNRIKNKKRIGSGLHICLQKQCLMFLLMSSVRIAFLILSLLIFFCLIGSFYFHLELSILGTNDDVDDDDEETAVDVSDSWTPTKLIWNEGFALKSNYWLDNETIRGRRDIKRLFKKYIEHTKNDKSLVTEIPDNRKPIIIYINSSFLRYFFQNFFPFIQYPYIVISGGSDFSIPTELPDPPSTLLISLDDWKVNRTINNNNLTDPTCFDLHQKIFNNTHYDRQTNKHRI